MRPNGAKTSSEISVVFPPTISKTKSTGLPPFARKISFFKVSVFASITSSAPNSLASFRFSSDEVTAITLPPQSFAN